MPDDDPLAAAAACADSQDGAITREQAMAAGLTPARLHGLRRSGRWHAPVRGVYIVDDPPDLQRATTRAATLALPGAVVCGVSAARLLDLGGLPLRRPAEPVHLVVPRSVTRERRDGLCLHWSTLLPEEVADVDGIQVTTVHRTLADLALGASRESGVGILDAALNQGRIGPEHLPVIRLMMRGRPGVRRAATWWDLLDERAESPLESRIRLILLDAGLGPETLQHVVWDAGRAIARLDLAWPSRKFAVEADGASAHDGPAPLYRDRERQNALVALGWRLIRLTWADALSPVRVVQEVGRHLR